MSRKRVRRYRKLSYEILGLIAVSALFAVMLFLILTWTGGAIVGTYCYNKGLELSEYELLEVDGWIYATGGILSACGFSLLFLALLGDRMAYIKTITDGIDSLRQGKENVTICLEGRNELTRLADSINYMSATQRQLREKEQELALEKEHFIRALSHDIRTPLTSVLAYSEYLVREDGISEEERKNCLNMINRKAEQIRDLTGLLLDSDKRDPEYFENAHLLMEQLAAEFEEEFEDRFCVRTDLGKCSNFAGTFDVQELRRIFDNLSSNVQKYADPEREVCLTIVADGKSLCFFQTNGVLALSEQRDSYKLGINSIRRIAQNYGGKVTVDRGEDTFSISVTLTDF